MGLIIHIPKAISQRHHVRHPVTGARILAQAKAEADTPHAQAERAAAITDELIGDWPPTPTTPSEREHIEPLFGGVQGILFGVVISLWFWAALVAILVSWP